MSRSESPSASPNADTREKRTDRFPRWLGPFQELDHRGDPTGAAYLACPECAVEVLIIDRDRATHRAGCPRRDG